MKYPLLFVIFVVMCCMACGEILEEDITTDQVHLLSPGDGLQTRSYAQQLLWQQVAGARNYHVQIAEPSFDSLRTIVLDTLVAEDRYTCSLSPGRYQWRVSAENAGYQTAYSTRSFEVFPSSLVEQQVILQVPSKGLLSRAAQLDFSWANLFGANSYRLQIDTNNFSDTTALVLNEQLTGISLTYGLEKDQNYQWRVQGQNDSLRSQWSVVRHFTIDRTPPAAVNLTAPGNNSTVATPVPLSWQAVAGDAQYELYVYLADSTTTVAGFPKTMTNSSYSFDDGTLGDRFLWRVRAKDTAGNIGEFSTYRSFLIQ